MTKGWEPPPPARPFVIRGEGEVVVAEKEGEVVCRLASGEDPPPGNVFGFWFCLSSSESKKRASSAAETKQKRKQGGEWCGMYV
jgi:hypothetical protein